MSSELLSLEEFVNLNRLQIVIYDFFSCSTNIPPGLSAYKPQRLVVYCLRTFELTVSAHPYCARKITGHVHSRPQRPCSFWSALRIVTSGLVQRHSGFEWLCKHNRLRAEPIRFVRLDSGHAQSDGKSVNRGLPVLDLDRGRDSWC